jgi:hypothetical protein
MSDARISTGLPSHPKTKKLIRRLGAAGPWALVCLFLWARDNRSDGNLYGMSDEDIELACDWSGDSGALVAALMEVRFIDGDEGGRVIHDWTEHQPWSAGSEDRSERAKWRALIKHHGRDVAAKRMPEYAASIGEASSKHASSMLLAEPSMLDGATRSAPSPSPSPSPSPDQKLITPVGVVSNADQRQSRLAEVTEQAIEAFNATLSVKAGGLLSAVTIPSDKRKAQVKRTLKLASQACERLYGSKTVTPEFWAQYFEEVKCDPFKSGVGPYGKGHENWRPDFEYLTRPDVVEAVIDDAMSRGEQ